MDPTAISLAVRGLRSTLADAMALDERQIHIGHPAAISKTATNSSEQALGVFAYQVEHSGQPADATSDDPVYVHVHCMITAFGRDEEVAGTTVSAGENDLRLIGAVIAALHEAPTIHIDEPEHGERVATLQVVPVPLSAEMINNVWSTQLEASYRLSVVYELAFAPVPLRHRSERSPRVAAALARVHATAGPGSDERDWIPRLGFATGGGIARSRAVRDHDLPATLAVAAAGAVGAEVTLTWEIWDAEAGWRAMPDADQPITIDAASLDQSSEHPAVVPPLAPGAARQAMVFARRAVTRGGREVTLRSDPILLSVYTEDEA